MEVSQVYFSWTTWTEGGTGLKIKLSVSMERYQEIHSELLALGIEIDENSDLVLLESGRYIDTLVVKDVQTTELVRLPVGEIVSVEAFGHSIEVFAQGASYQARERLYKIEAMLDPEKFLRVSNSVIVAREKIRKISPSLSMKFVLTMSDGRSAVVTRSYYYIFREAMGI